MPQIIIEYSSNIQDVNDFKQLFTDIHHVINTTGGANIENCKSRAINHNEYLIGRGEAMNAFIHLEVKWLEGRSTELKSQLGNELLDLLKKHYHSSMQQHNLQITVHVIDILRSSYFKHPEETFTVLL